MRVPVELAEAFGPEFERQIADFAVGEGLMPSAEELKSHRFLNRSVIPHVRRMSGMFNRIQRKPDDEIDGDTQSKRPLQPAQKESRADQEVRHRAGLDAYWKGSSNPANFRLAYFLYFMPSNLFRVASVWAELGRLGYKWPFKKDLRAIELGAGPASGASGIAAGERFAQIGLPNGGNWALIERDRSMLDLGAKWSEQYYASQGFSEWSNRTFHRTLELGKPLLPPSAPKFQLWVMSYFLNEAAVSAEELAASLVKTWERHLEEEGMVLILEPALRLQSRRLLELRQALLKERKKHPWLQILLPCLGHQACGALAKEDDWCHEEVTWWRPPYFRIIDDLAGLDRKTLPFSYLVITRSSRKREEILPALAESPEARRYRLVSPAHSEGRELEFFVCGQDGKRRARYRPSDDEEIGRGDILADADIRGDTNASRIENLKKKI